MAQAMITKDTVVIVLTASVQSLQLLLQVARKVKLMTQHCSKARKSFLIPSFP